MTGDENKKKLSKEIIIVIAAAVLIIAVATIFIADFVIDSKREEKLASAVNDEISKKLDENRKKAGEIGENRNLDLVGEYVSGGEANSTEAEKTYISFKLEADGTASVITLANEIISGWWASENKNGIEFVAIGFQNNPDPVIYQVYDNHLININSLYFGHVYKTSSFDTTFVSDNETGTMTLNLTTDKKAKGEFIDKNEESDNYGIKFAYSGSYEADGEFVTIELNGAVTKFVMFDYNINDSDKDSGIASVYYSKKE